MGWQEDLQNDPASIAYRARQQAAQNGQVGYNDAQYNADRNAQAGQDIMGKASGSNEQDFWTHYVQPEQRGENAAYNPNSLGFQYGGRFGRADATVGAAYDQARMADQRQAYQMDPTQQNQARGYQGIAAGSYIDTLRGRNPSVAQQQLAAGMGQAAGAAGGMAASARGGGANLASAQRNALRTQGDISSQYNNQAAQLRAQEIAQAQAGLANVGGQMRGQDQGWQNNQANLEQNQRQMNDARNARYWQSAQDVNRDQLGANMAQEQLRYNADKDQREQNERVQASNVKRSQGLADGVINSFGKLLSFSDERLKKDVADDNPYGPMVYQGGINRMVEPAGAAGDGSKSRSVLDNYRDYVKMLQDDRSKDSGAAKDTGYEAASDFSGGLMSGMGSMMGGGGGGMGGGMGLGMLSDKRLKKDAMDAADAMQPKSYRYKWEDESEPKRVGVMAQDLEKSKMGKDAVVDLPMGKAIDVNRGLSLALASVAALKDEVDSLKKGRR